MTTSPPEYKKPIPRPANPTLTKPFWDAAKQHKLIVPRCKACSRYHFYPREQCPYCFSMDLEWVPAAGKARVYTFSVVHQPENRNFTEDCPYVHAIVQLTEGVLMPTAIVGCAPEEVHVDMEVEPAFDDVTPEWTLVKFKPVA